MNQIIQFIKAHPHCTEWMCMTCGGLWAFISDLKLWVHTSSPDLPGLFQALTPTDLLEVNEWPVFLDLVLQSIPEPARSQAVYPAWWNHRGENLEYDLFAIHHAPANSFVPDRDSQWIRQVSISVVKKDLEKEAVFLVQLLGAQANQFPELTAFLDFVAERNRFRQEIEDQEIAAFKAEKIRLEKLKAETHARLSPLEPKQRLVQILEQPSLQLDSLPEEWAAVSDDLFAGLDSLELTRLIKLLASKMHKKDTSGWGELRSRLYRLRQKVYNQEKGYSREP